MKLINPATEEIIKEVNEDTKEALQGSLNCYNQINIHGRLVQQISCMGAYYLITNQAFFYHL